MIVADLGITVSFFVAFNQEKYEKKRYYPALKKAMTVHQFKTHCMQQYFALNSKGKESVNQDKK